jgi:hypothetical protein
MNKPTDEDMLKYAEKKQAEFEEECYKKYLKEFNELEKQFRETEEGKELAKCKTDKEFNEYLEKRYPDFFVD